MKLKNILLLLALAMSWGPSFFFIKVGIETIPPLTLVLIRLLLGSSLLFMMILMQKEKVLPYFKYYKYFLIMGLTANALPFVLISYGEIYISSSLAGIINGSVPIFTVVLSHFCTQDEKATKHKIIGIILGFIGIMIVYIPTLLDKKIGNEMGILMVLVASISYAVAMVYSKKHAKKIPGLIAPAMQLLFAGTLITPFTLYFDRPWNLAMPSTSSLLSVFCLAFLGSAIAFMLYYKIVKETGATYLSMVTLLFPIIAIIFGTIFLGERPCLNDYIGCAFILLGLIIANKLYTKHKPVT